MRRRIARAIGTSWRLLLVVLPGIIGMAFIARELAGEEAAGFLAFVVLTLAWLGGIALVANHDGRTGRWDGWDADMVAKPGTSRHGWDRRQT